MIEILPQAGPQTEHAYLAGSASIGLGNALLTDEKHWCPATLTAPGA